MGMNIRLKHANTAVGQYWSHLGVRWLTNVEAVGDRSDCWRCELSADETEEPICRCCSCSTFDSHRDRIDFGLIDPRYHSPGTAERSVVAKEKGYRNSAPLVRVSYLICNPDRSTNLLWSMR